MIIGFNRNNFVCVINNMLDHVTLIGKKDCVVCHSDKT